jgi:hypothetical protein
MNLLKSIPKSPKKKMEGLVMLPRMMDKAIAYKSNTLGEYIFPCPLDKIVLKFLDTTHEEFANKAQILTEKEFSLWVNDKCLNKSINEKNQINNKILEQKPDNQQSLDRFHKILNSINPDAKNITTWIDLIELEENNILPKIL